MNIYEELKTDHDEVKELLRELVALSNEDKERYSDLVGEIRDALIPHSRAEEAVFYNSIREVNGAQSLAWHGYEEHMMAEGILRSLQALDKFDIQAKQLAQKLKAALEHHISEEEGRIFAAARQLFTEEEAAEMARAFNELKPEVKEGGFIKSTLDMVANMMPSRLSDPLRNFIYPTDKRQ